MNLVKDKVIAKAIKDEEKRQLDEIELIASENYVSKSVLEATGSVFTNKYAEGYPSKRYYGGTKYADVVENIAIERLCKLFDVKYANVQPHSGSQANSATYLALLKPGSKIMGLSLAAGGHLTHGYKVNFSGIVYQGLSYDVDKNGVLDYDAIEKQVLKEKPHLIVAGYSAYPRDIDWKRFRLIANKVNAYLMADIAHIAGLIATKVLSNPSKYVDVMTSTTHKTLRGARGGVIMTNNPELIVKINRAVFPISQGGPLMHVIAAKAVTFGEALKPSFQKYCQNIVKNSQAFSQAFVDLGTKVITGGTDNHLFVVDVKSSYNLTGAQAQSILEKNNIISNKNMIPHDTTLPTVTSGIRFGTSAMTTRNFTTKEFIELAKMIDQLWKNPNLDFKNKVVKWARQFPIPQYF